jgi:energy-coupling factor transport system ATP-binding protein
MDFEHTKASQIEISHLCVSFGNRQVLRDISFRFNTNERILVLGASGCGKSTLLLTIMGIVQRSEAATTTGELLLDGKPITTMRPSQIARTMGLVFQNPESQFCTLYPREEVAFGLENLAVKAELMDNIIERSLKSLGFPKKRRQATIGELSGGEQQRLACASILAQGARMLLLDEPTANLDPEGRHQVSAAAKSMAVSGHGLLVVEHNLEDWVPLIDRVIVLNRDGSLLCDGSPRDIFTRYGQKMRAQGVWQPQAVRLSDELAGLGCPLSPLPLDAAELKDLRPPQELLKKAFTQAFGTQRPHKRSGTAILEAQDVSVRYGQTATAVSHVSLKITQGSFIALVGRNGSGKSTLAKALAALIKPEAGTVSLFGHDVFNMSSDKLFSTIGYVFQNPEHQFLRDSVWAELAYSVDQAGSTGEDAHKNVKDLIDKFDLGGLEAENPFSLSGGQQRKLSVATMLAGGRKILILDEPTFGQDEQGTCELMEKLSELNRAGVTILMITHDLDLVDRYADEVVMLINGSLAYCGNPRGLWQKRDLLTRGGLEVPFREKIAVELPCEA